MKKILAILLVLTMALGVCPALAESANTDITATLTFAHHRSDLEMELNQLVKDFNEVYPNITINLEILADYESVLPIRLAANEMPDIFECSYGLLAKDKWAEYVLPQDDSPLFGNVNAQEYYTIDGTVYSYPAAVNYYAFMYNKNVWQLAGITAAPTTWDELVSDLEKISQLDGVIPLTSQFKTTWALNIWFDYYYRSLKADLFQEMADSDTPFSDETFRKLMDGFRDLKDKNLLDPDLMSSDWDLQATDFTTDTIGTYLVGTYANGTMVSLGMDANDIGFFGMPALDDSGVTYTCSSADYGLAISKNCESAEAAKLFVDFYTRNYANYTNQINPMIGEDCVIPGVNEMFAAGTVVKTRQATPTEIKGIYNAAAFSAGEYIQEYLTAEDPQTVVDKYNEAWTAGRSEYYGK